MRKVQPIEISRIKPSLLNPRGEFDDDTVRGLAESIDEDGLIQPMVVRLTDDPDYDYEVVCGHRRLRALQLLGRQKGDCIVRKLSDRETLLFMLKENIQRQALNPICIANGYRQLKDEMGMTQVEIADEVGATQGTVSNKLKLLRLAEELQNAVLRGELSVTRAYTYARFTPEEQLSVYEDTRKVATDDLHYHIEIELGYGAFDMPEDVDVEKLADKLNEGQATFDDPEDDVSMGFKRLGRRLGRLNSTLRSDARHFAKHRDSLALMFRMKPEKLVGALDEMEHSLEELLDVVRHANSASLELHSEEQEEGEAA